MSTSVIHWFLLRSNWLLVLVMGYKFAITNSVRALWYTCSNVCMSHLYSPVTRQKFGFELTAPKNLMICLWLSMLRMLAYYNRRGRLIRLHWGIIHSGHWLYKINIIYWMVIGLDWEGIFWWSRAWLCDFSGHKQSLV